MNKDEDQFDYQRIKLAIEYISKNHLTQPSLNTVAKEIGVSPFHFQRLFTRWAGVSPKKFLQFTSVAYARRLLQQEQATLFDVALESGLSGTGRLHDLFINFEAMTPGEYKNGGAALDIIYKTLPTIFGNVLIAKTHRGICHLAFEDREEEGLQRVKKKFPSATFYENDDPIFHRAVESFAGGIPKDPLPLHLKGTPFQIKVWEALLRIPEGKISTYGKIAKDLGIAGASRAVGTSIGANPVAVLIPCHRVIQSTGLLGGYRWEPARKKIILAREAALQESKENHLLCAGNSAFI